MVIRSNYPPDKARELRDRLFASAKRSPRRRRQAQETRRGDGLTEAWNGGSTKEACMRREKTIGKPCGGKPHARFERGPQETGPRGYRA